MNIEHSELIYLEGVKEMSILQVMQSILHTLQEYMIEHSQLWHLSKN